MDRDSGAPEYWRPAEDFETTTRRYAARPDAQRNVRNWLRTFVGFIRTPLSTGYNPERLDRELRVPKPPAPSLAMANERWKAEHGAQFTQRPATVRRAMFQPQTVGPEWHRYHEVLRKETIMKSRLLLVALLTMTVGVLSWAEADKLLNHDGTKNRQVSSRPELEYLKAVNSVAPPQDPQLLFLLMGEFANTNRQEEGAEQAAVRLIAWLLDGPQVMDVSDDRPEVRCGHRSVSLLRPGCLSNSALPVENVTWIPASRF